MKMNPDKTHELGRIRAFLQQDGLKLAAIDQAARYMLQKSYPLDDVLLAYENYLAKNPEAANAAFNYAWHLARDGQFEPAIEWYRRALELGIAHPEEVHLNIANIHMDHLKEYEKARAEIETALALNPGYVGAYHNLGNLSEQMGDRDQAAACFEKCLEIEPLNESALARLADAHRFLRPDDPLLARLVNAARSTASSDLHFALGNAYNQLADYETAWQNFSQANALDRKILPPYDREGTEARFNRIMSLCDTSWLSRFQGASKDPVFICGMFRTGSTLLEQVLAAHPRFTAGGESEFYPRLVLREFLDYPEGLDEITADEMDSWRKKESIHSARFTIEGTRLTDKRPDNFLYIGLIKAILPSARFVVTERDWRDTALSIFCTRLGALQNYSTSLEDIRHYIGLQERLVGHWASILGDSLLHIRYEDFVAHPRETLGQLLQDLGEEWDERCLSFNELDNAVQTASVWQVREPLHSRSIGRWKNYRAYFEEISGR